MCFLLQLICDVFCGESLVNAIKPSSTILAVEFRLFSALAMNLTRQANQGYLPFDASVCGDSTACSAYQKFPHSLCSLGQTISCVRNEFDEAGKSELSTFWYFCWR